jgi:transcription factor 1
MKPSLEKHIGCDIIDLNPGPGVWSSALHDFLKPRTHILMEPDHASYKPLLKPLLDAEGSTYKFIPKSGVIWSSLQEALSPELLPCQKTLDHGDSRLEEPNHTLLLVANLGYNPRKPYRGFLSLPSLVIYQLLSAARSHSLFHKYGLIRMLIWVDDEEKRMVLPRNIVNRRKGTIEAEVTCSDIVEVASSTDAAGTFLRDHTIDLESSIAVLKRMKEVGIKTPQGRLGPLQIEATEGMSSSPKAEPKKKREFYKDLEDLERRFAAGEFSMLMDTPGKCVPSESLNKRRRSLQTSEWTHMATLISREKTAQKKGKDFAYKEELHQLRERFAAGEFQKYPSPEVEMLADGRRRRAPETSPYSPEFQRLQYLRRRSKSEGKRERIAQTLCEDYDAIMSMRRELLNLEGSAADSLLQEINERFDLWREEFALIKNDQDTSSVVCNMLDNRSVYSQDPPVLFWDRRKAEPLRTDPDEFFPRTGMALLDFQPRSMWPVLRENFPANYDVFEYIISNLLILPTQSVRQGLTSLAPGAFDWLIPECPSITDPNKGGNPDLDLMRVRCLSQEMYKEIIEAWMRWPFRPSRYELLGRVGSEIHDPDGDKFWATENQ